MRFMLVTVLAALVSAGCATSTSAGRAALNQGRPAEAAERFQEALAEDPDRVDALIGLGVSRYRLGNYAEAIPTLAEAMGRVPGDPGVRLYLALSHLRRSEDAAAIEQLAALRGLGLHPRFAAHVDRTLALLRDRRLDESVRGYVAADLEDAAGWSREIAEARQALSAAHLAWDPFWGRPYTYVRCRRC